MDMQMSLCDSLLFQDWYSCRFSGFSECLSILCLRWWASRGSNLTYLVAKSKEFACHSHRNFFEWEKLGRDLFHLVFVIP
jgi:hypothetical protein